MDRSQRDPKLGEVRAVLQRLQTFSAQPDSAELPAETRSDAGRTSKSGAVGLVAAAIALTTAGAGVVFWLTVSPAGRPHAPTATTAGVTLPVAETPPGSASVNAPALPPANPTAALEVAQGLLARGEVQAARKQLLGLASADSVDVAWMLARSYDPNFLAAIPAPDAGPDIEQAARWYREWHVAAVKEGMVPNSVSVERIISSMR